jgi:hypothetical protein
MRRSFLTRSEKKEYIAAVKCLASKPAKTPAGLAAGAKNRYDDFVATHINQTMAIHGTVLQAYLNCGAMSSRVDRETSWPGTGTSPGLMNRPCATSAVTGAISRITTGRSGQTTLPSLPLSTAPIRACLAMESSSQAAQTHVFRRRICAASVCLRAMEVAVSSPVLSRSKSSLQFDRMDQSPSHPIRVAKPA